MKLNFKAWKHFLKEAEAREEDKPWYRGQSGPWGRSAGRVSQLQGENGARGRNGGRRSESLPYYDSQKYFIDKNTMMTKILNWRGRSIWTKCEKKEERKAQFPVPSESPTEEHLPLLQDQAVL